MTRGIRITAVRPSGDVVLRSGLGSYMTVDRDDIDTLIQKLCIVRDMPPEAFCHMMVDGSCLVDKVV